MKPLIIYAHPDTERYCPKILDTVTSNLKEYNLIDLYKEKYDPVIHEDELYTRDGRDVSDRNKQIQELIRKANKIIFIYPVFWASMPAILKGFFDKVLTPGFGVKYKNGIPVKLLKGRKALVIITSGAPWWYFRFIDRTPIKLIKKNILGFCGIKSSVLHFGSCKAFNKGKSSAICHTVNSQVKKFTK